MNHYTNNQILEMCRSKPELNDLELYLFYSVHTNPDFDFNETIKKLINTKKADRKWRSIYRLLYETPYKDLPLYIGSPKKYKVAVASWRLSCFQ